MRELLILSAHSFREQLRSRFFSMILLFGGLILYMSLLLGALAADQELRVLLDFGLSFIELMATGAACYAAATGLLRELEMKTIYLVLTRPVSRSSYLLGRFFGLLAAAACAIGVMSLLHLSLLFLKGWQWENAYLLALAGIGLKLMVAASLATFLALVSTSALSALSMTAIAWMLGHFASEMRFLLERSGLQGRLLGAAVYLIPNLQLFNFRDRAGSGLEEPVLFAFLYAPLYTGACLWATLLLFKRKEF